ncbi:hypothetical protein [Bordetella petrii]|uniref:hypothetical protein n=1 Tax=Bordetella petrii TaxID=94624 RepID=UPI001E29F246|nr:hypothetical protein [Bordetella petrii]MCD0502517.1 hypothetical protein [Bordetella petrii]
MIRSSSEGWSATRKLAWAVGLSLAVVLAGCSGSDSDDGDPGAPPPDGGTPTECAADANCAPAP